MNKLQGVYFEAEDRLFAPYARESNKGIRAATLARRYRLRNSRLALMYADAAVAAQPSLEEWRAAFRYSVWSFTP